MVKFTQDHHYLEQRITIESRDEVFDLELLFEIIHIGQFKKMVGETIVIQAVVADIGAIDGSEYAEVRTS